LEDKSLNGNVFVSQIDRVRTETTVGCLVASLIIHRKWLLLGIPALGRHAFIRFVRGMFDEESQPTLGVEFLVKIVATEKHKIQLQLWDTAGHEFFRSVTRGDYRGWAGALLVFDLTNRDLFESIGQWIQDVRDVARSDVIAVLIGRTDQ
jgi:GTPase SAR1 family protein